MKKKTLRRRKNAQRESAREKARRAANERPSPARSSSHSFSLSALPRVFALRMRSLTIPGSPSFGAGEQEKRAARGERSQQQRTQEEWMRARAARDGDRRERATRMKTRKERGRRDDRPAFTH